MQITLLSALLDVVLPVALVVLVGTIVGRFHFIDRTSVSRLALYALTPALAFDTLSNTKVHLTEFFRIAISYVLAVVFLGLCAWFMGAKLEENRRRSLVLSVILGNNGNFGLPMSLFAFGQAGLELSVMVFLTSVLMTFVVGPMVLSSRQGLWQGVVASFRLPLLWSATIGWMVNLLGLHVPSTLSKGLHLLSQATVPLLLLALGLQMAREPLVWPSRAVWSASTLRLLGGPLAALFITKLLGIDGMARNVLLLSSTMPTAVNAFLLADELKGDAKMVADTVVLTTLLSVPCIALMLTIIG